MSAKIYTFAHARRIRSEASSTDKASDFQALFDEARIIRFAGREYKADEIAQVDWVTLRDWFHREIADEVFKQKLFDKSILISISYVSEMLTNYAKGALPEVEVTNYLSAYTAHGDPASLLKAAHSSFILYVFWPKTRLGRMLKYRKFALEMGPGLFSMYASEVRNDFGYYMADAFESLGNIAHERLAPIETTRRYDD